MDYTDILMIIYVKNDIIMIEAYIIQLNKGHISTDFYNMIYNFF